MTAAQPSLLDLMVSPPVRLKVSIDEPVEKDVDETLALPSNTAWPSASIEIHRDRVSGFFMWAINWNVGDRGGGYAVGRKWNNFAETRGDALHWAREELLHRIRNQDCKAADRVRAWAAALA